MNRYLKPKLKKRLYKGINLIIVLTLVLSLIPSSLVQAASHHQGTTTDGNCVPANTSNSNDGGPSIFLPLISTNGALSALSGLLSGAQAAPRTIQWEGGKTYIYDYKVEVNSAGYSRDFEGPTQEDGASKTVVHGTAEIAITNVAGDGTATGQVQLKDPFVCSADTKNQTDAVSDDAEFAAALQQPIIFQQQANGTVTSVQLPEGADAAATNVLKGIVNALQFTLQADSSEYAVEETGGQGTYNAQYALTEAGDNLNIARTYNRDSFTSLNTVGDETSSLSIDTSTTAVLDGATGVLASVNTKEKMTTGDGVEEPDGSNKGFEGQTAWTEISTSVDLTFGSVADTPSILAASLSGVYVQDDLGAKFDESELANPNGIDFETLDLDAEIDALVAAPRDPAIFLRVIQILDADEGSVVIDKVEEKLVANSANDEATTALIDVLATSGSPEAQEILAGLIDPSQEVSAAAIGTTMSEAAREHALISLVLVDTPVMTAVNAIKNVSQAESGIQNTAITVLGAAANKLVESDPEMAASLNSDLIAGLGTSASQEDLDVYLGALGNAGQADSVDEISQYLAASLTLNGEIITDTQGIQFSAYSALGGISGQAAEDLLVAGLSDEAQDLGNRISILELMSNRDDLSAAGLAALSAYASLADANTNGEVSAADANAPLTTYYSKSWNRTFGNSKLGVELPGNFSASGPPGESGISVYAEQKADGLVWNKKINIATGKTKLWRTNDKYRFGVWLYLADYKISREYETDLTQGVMAASADAAPLCTFDKSGNLWRFNKSYGKSFSIPVVGIITVGVQVNVGASASLDWSVGGNVCDLTNLNGSAAIVPSVYATASAQAYVSLVVVRGGVEVSAKILDSSFELGATAAYANSNFRICIDAEVKVKALSGKVSAFADRRNWRLKWKRFWTGTLVTFNTPTKTYTLLNSCYG